MTPLTQHYFVFSTAAGYCALAWSDSGITRFVLPETTADESKRNLLRRVVNATPAAPSEDLMQVIDAVTRYFDGEQVDFSEARLDLQDQDEFLVQVYSALRHVSWGQTTTYGTLAKELGSGPEGARDVGIAMAKNPVPLIIPCHRVLAAGGKLGGFSASGGTSTKRHMLELEGVRVGPSEPPQQALPL